MIYPIAIEPGSETAAYGVVVPDIPGCYSAGDTFEEALENAKEAIELWLEVASENGQEIPTASKVDAHVKNPAYAGWIWAAIEVDVSQYLGKAQKVTITLPENLIKRIDDKVAGESSYKNRSHFIAEATLKELRKGAA